MKARDNKIRVKKQLLNDYKMMINMDRLFFKCLLFFGSMLVVGIIVFAIWMSG